MSEIDLVPGEHRLRRRLQRLLRGFGLAYLAAALAIVGLRAGLAQGVQARRSHIDLVEEAVVQERASLSRLDALQRDRRDAMRQLTLLEGLRGGRRVRDLVLAVDDAMVPGIWFTRWSFRRAGEVVERDRKAVQTGYFLVVPLEGDDPDAAKKAWLMQTHMEIRGRAVDHAALAEFARGLVARSEFAEVRVINTRERSYRATDVIDFELAAVVREGR